LEKVVLVVAGNIHCGCDADLWSIAAHSQRLMASTAFGRQSTHFRTFCVWSLTDVWQYHFLLQGSLVHLAQSQED